MSDKNARIGFFNHGRSGCSWYRVIHPMNALKRAGVEVELLELNKDIDITGLTSVQIYGAYPFSFDKALTYFKENNIKIVYDMDDALDLIEPTNPFYHSVLKDAGSQHQILQYADEVTVSTPKMKEYAEERTKAKVTVLPNCYDPEEWTFKRPQRDGIRIGFAGAAPHVSDLIDIIPTIKKLQDSHNVKFLIMGFGATDYATWYKQYRYIAQPEATKELRKLDQLLSEIVFEWIPFVDYSLYPQVLTNLALDIGICPLKDTPFNQHRSACKAMEYTLSGALALASDVEAYKIDNNSTKIKDNWEAILTTYINNPQILEIDRNAYIKWTQENRNRNINDKIDLLKEIYIV